MKASGWKSWKDTKLAKREEPDPKDYSYSVEECLSRLLPEKSYNPKENEWVKKLIKRRFEQRFIKPLENLTNKQSDDEYVAVGFTIMAIASLMIETLACFRNGQWTTHDKKSDPRWVCPACHGKGATDKWRKGKESFKDFLEDTGNSFNSDGILFGPSEGETFYTEIRCGILHQAETKGGWRIERIGDAVKRSPNSINAIEFLKLLVKELDRYIKDLDDHADPNNVSLWKSCRYKLLGICASSGWDMTWPVGSGTSVDWADYW